MNCKGLFIGIDKYASPDISWLNCGVNDALAIFGLFHDNLGSDATCLINEDASKENILQALENLQTVGEDDFVLLTFSGHGTSTYEILCYDSDEDELSKTSISFDELFEAIQQVPSKRMLCILDCCFSGGYGTRSVKNGLLSRNHLSAPQILSNFSGKGKVIFTASTDLEHAWEYTKYGHGIFTYCFIEELKAGFEKNDSIEILQLFSKVSSAVKELAEKQGKIQTPTLYGSIEGGLYLPFLKPGECYYKYFPALTNAKITSEISSLKEFGFPDTIIELWKDISSFNKLQITAVNDYGLLNEENLLVSAPTSSGKTLIGELAAVSAALKRKRSIFLMPLKALVNDKYQEFMRKYSTQGIKIIRSTGDVSDQVAELMRGRYDICLMTYEKFAAIMLGLPHLLEQLGVIIVDEVQMIADKSRGVNLEFLLTVIKARKKHGIAPQLICLSAVIGDSNGFENWLDSGYLKEEVRPVPLLEGLVLYNGRIRTIDSITGVEEEKDCIIPQYGKGSSQDYIKPLVQKLVNEGKQVIVFRPSKGEAKGAAIYLSEYLGLAPANDLLEAMPKTDLSDASRRLREALLGGVAFHISDLEAGERLLIEEAFRKKDSAIRVIVATTTLAMGINTPAEAVIISGLEHPGKVPTPYSIAEYKNIIGRAGRLGFSERGYSFLLGTSSADAYNYWQRYILGKPEGVISRIFNEYTDLRSLIVRLLVSFPKHVNGNLGVAKEDIIDFLQSSFGAFHNMRKLNDWSLDDHSIARCLENLQANQLVKPNAGRYFKLTPLGRLAGESGVEVESIIRMSNLLNCLSIEDISDPVLIVVAQLSLELNEIYVPINSRGATKEMNSWKGELQGQGISWYILDVLAHGVDDRIAASRYKKAISCLFWISNTSMTNIENTMTRHGGKFDGFSGPLRSVASRTRDLITVVARIAELIHPGSEFSSRMEKLYIRLELGIPSKLCTIAKYLGNQFSRGDYHGLLSHGLTDWSHVEGFHNDQLLEILSGNEVKLKLLTEGVQNSLRQKDMFRENIPFIELPKYEE